MTKEIPLHGKYGQGKFAIVDDADYERIDQYHWNLSPFGYVYRRITGGHIIMHREIMGAAKGQEIDHANGNKLDNTRPNLRFATRSQNNGNRGYRADTISGYKGVTPFRGMWRARITVNYKEIHLGCFPTAQEAAQAYNQGATQFFGEFARLNEIP